MTQKLIFQAIVFLMIFGNSWGQQSDFEYIETHVAPGLRVAGEPVPYTTIEARRAYHHVPGASVAVVKDGKLAWSKGFGMADSETGRAVTTATMFQAGSISKPVAALAALKLYEEGKVDLDTDVNEYLKTWKVPANAFETQVTLRLLLTHSAGITVHGFPGYKPSEKFPSDNEVLNGEGNTDAILVDTEPGSTWRYSGGGYTIMEKVVEDVSGMSFQEYMLTNILQPMDMLHSTYEQPLGDTWVASASAAYDSEGNLIEGKWHNYPEQAAAGLWTTPEDLARYAMHIQGILAGKKGILTKKTVEEMLTKHLNEWGLGPGLRYDGDSLVFQHGGKNAGFTNIFGAFAHRGNAVIVMTNGDRGGALMNEILVAVSERFDWNLAAARTVELIDVTDAGLMKFTGNFEYEKEVPEIGKYQVKFSVKDGLLFMEDPNDPNDYHFSAMADNRFIDLKLNESVQFECQGDQCDSFKWNGSYLFNRIE